MFKLITSLSRPNTEVAFPRDAAELVEFVAQVDARFAADPEFVSIDRTTSEDGLTTTTVQFWKTEEAARAFWSDAEFLAPLVKYNTENGLIREFSVENIH